MKALIFSVLVLMQTAGMAQVKFASIENIGVVTGSSAVALQVQAINGVKYKTYRFGLGVGYDEYYFKTIPVFIDVRKNIFEKPQTPFVYFDLGTNFLTKKDEGTMWESHSYKAGLYLDAGVGYYWKLKGRPSFNISAGFSKKHVDDMVSYPFATIDPVPEKFSYHFNRVSLKLGLGF